MKLNKLVLFSLLLLSFYGHAQLNNGVAVYNIEPINFIFKKNQKMVSENSKNLYEKLQKEIEKASEKINYKLTFDKKKSFFKTNNNYLEGNSIAKISTRVLDKGNIYNNINGTKITQKDIYGNTFLIKSNSKDVKWTMSSETKKVGEFKCYKATTIKKIKTFNRKVTAWYSPEIPVQFGPLGYGNLPGLILKLEIERDGIYKLKEITLNPKIKIIIKEPQKGEKVTEEEFINISKEMYLRKKNGL